MTHLEKETTFDRKGYIVLKSNHEDDKIVIALEKWFEEKSDDNDVYYDKYGQISRVGEESVGPFVGYDYHDGHNWRTVTIYADFFVADYSRVDEDKECEILQAYFNKSYQAEGQGLKHYSADGFVFTESAWQGNWEIATVEEK